MELVIIKPEQRELIDPHALEKWDEGIERLKKEAHLDELTEADFDAYLSDEAKQYLIDERDNLVKWVRGCTHPNPRIAGTYIFSMLSPQTEFLRLSRGIEKIYNRKQAKQKELEEQQRELEAKREVQKEAIEAERRERERLVQVKAEFNHSVEKFKRKLSKDELPLTYPLEQYHPDLWFNFEPPTDNEILTWLRPKAYALIPEKLRELVTWRWLSKPRIFIQAYYEKEEIPCIAFNFMVTVLARVIFYFKAGTYNYSGFTLKLEEERLGEVIIQKENYEPAGELSVPISLLCLLVSDQLEAQGIEVTSICDNYTVYRVRGFKGEVTIHHDFRRFLRDICHENGLVNGLLAWGLIDNQIAEIVETKMNELGQLQAEQKPSPLEDKIKRRDTKKARAFQLFSEGKGPTSPELKALGMHKSTPFKYYKYYKHYVAEYKP